MASLTTGDSPRTLLHPGFIGAGSALLVTAFVTDVIYYQTSLMQWANFSTWLIAAGLILALRRRSISAGWLPEGSTGCGNVTPVPGTWRRAY